MKRRMLAFMLSSSMVLGAVPTAFAAESISVEDVQGAQTVEADSTTQSGYCGAEKDGKNLKWTFKDGVLTVSGKGKMEDCNSESGGAWWPVQDKIQYLVLEEGVTNLDDYALDECGEVVGIAISSTVTDIGDGAFDSCPKLTDISVDSNNKAYTSIDGVLFSKDKTELVRYPKGKTEDSYQIPDGVTKIGNDAFWGCKNLTSVTMPKGVTSIGRYAFGRCENLSGFTIPEGVKSIGKYAFYECDSLPEVTIPDSVKSIGDEAFDGCEALSKVTLGSGITNLSKCMFSGCSNLTDIVIPDNVTSMDKSAFSGCGLKEIVIPDSMTSIGSGVFYNCANLSDVKLGKNVKTIEDSAFYNCKSLTNIVLPNSVTSIGEEAFSNSALESIAIPDSVTSIGKKAFNNCDNLQSISIGSGLKKIGKYNFADCDSLTKVTIPKTVKTIGEYAFHDCEKLAEVNMKSGVKTIGEYAFEDCTGLNTLKIANTVTEIGIGAFRRCTGLETLVIPDSVITVGDEAFHGCDSLKTVKIGNGTKNIGSWYSFGSCSHATSLTVGKSITYLDHMAFGELRHIQEIKFMGNAPKMSSRIFRKATLVAYYPQGNKTWTASVMKNYGGNVTWKAWDAENEHIHTEVTTDAVKATLTKNGKTEGVSCSECGYVIEKPTTVYKASKIKLSRTSYKYNGKAKKPKVIVKDSRGRTISPENYTVTYSDGRRNIGTYTVTVEFTGENYTGTKTLTFRIKR